MSAREPLRALFARDHTTIHAGVGVFLAGPTPPDDVMLHGWRRVVIAGLAADPRLCPCMTVVAPEPEHGRWQDIVVSTGHPRRDSAVNKQIQWEWQYLELCRVTAFWMPTYWEPARSGPFPANIGPTTRLEYGYFLGQWEHDPRGRDFVVGAPADAQDVKWARHLARSRGLAWHELPAADKAALVAPSFIAAIADALLRRKWCDCP